MLQATSSLAQQLLEENTNNIGEIKKEIQTLRKDKLEGWKVELAYLSEELKQLHEERLVLLRKLET